MLYLDGHIFLTHGEGDQPIYSSLFNKKDLFMATLYCNKL